MTALLAALGAGGIGVFVYVCGYYAGRRRECGLWEDWYEREEAAVEAEAAAAQKPAERRFVTLRRVEFRRRT